MTHDQWLKKYTIKCKPLRARISRGQCKRRQDLAQKAVKYPNKRIKHPEWMDAFGSCVRGNCSRSKISDPTARADKLAEDLEKYVGDKAPPVIGGVYGSDYDGGLRLAGNMCAGSE
jgi:hypothetical protein